MSFHPGGNSSLITHNSSLLTHKGCARLRFLVCMEIATRNLQLFLQLLGRVPVRVCVPYIYKIKLKKIIYTIELRCADLKGKGKRYW